MIRTEQEKTREIRKINILSMFSGDQVLYTNQVAKNLKVVWPVADRLLRELLDEGKLMGGKSEGYSLYIEPKPDTFWQKLKRRFHGKN